MCVYVYVWWGGGGDTSHGVCNIVFTNTQVKENTQLLLFKSLKCSSCLCIYIADIFDQQPKRLPTQKTTFMASQATGHVYATAASTTRLAVKATWCYAGSAGCFKARQSYCRWKKP